MAKRPILDAIENQLKKGENFSLTDESYHQKTGVWLPRDKSYTEKRSALARKCEQYGYKVYVAQSRTVCFEKIN